MYLSASFKRIVKLLTLLVLIFALGIGSSSFVYVSRVEAASGNLALNKPATSNAASCIASETPAQAVDGSSDSKWCSLAAGTKWLQIDLGSTMTLNRWTVKNSQVNNENPDFNTKDYTLQISTNGTTFTDVDTVAGNTAGITNRIISAANARYVRLYVTNPNQNLDHTVRINEFEVFNDPPASDANNLYVFDIGAYLNTGKAVTDLSAKGRYVKITVHTPTQNGKSIIRLQEIELYNNLALGKPATATNANSKGEEASYAVDGSAGTHWASTSSGPHWLTIDLGVSKTIKKWIVRNAQAGGEPASYNTKNYKLQVSDNGTTFTDVDTVSGNTAAVTERSLSGSTGRYFRLYITTPNNNGDQVARIREFELYDSGNLAMGKTAKVTDSNSKGETGDEAIDGLLNTHWSSTTSTADRSITIDLGSSQKFNRWLVKHAGANGEPVINNTKSYDIAVSDDNSNFKLVDKVNNNTASSTDRTLGSGKLYATKYGYDFLKMAATFQGIINRNGPKVYFKYKPSQEVGVTFNFNPDTFWLTQLSKSGQILNGKKQIIVQDFYNDLYSVFANQIAGTAVWDENVPSTSNVASTVAGVENLLPVRYDTSNNSLYTELQNKTNLSQAVNLVDKFSNSSGTIWNTNPGIGSTGSAKNNAYEWARQKYIETKKVNDSLIAYHVDAYSKDRDATNTLYYWDEMFNRMLINQDYYINKKAFFFDLSPSKTLLPNDDPKQPAGTDRGTFVDILTKVRANAGTKTITVGGFTQWQLKYTNYVYGGGMEPVDAEWQTTDILSAQNAQIDADAPSLMGLANASIYKQVTLNTLTQKNDKGSGNTTQYDPNKRYVMLYMGDYDSAAWSAGNLPALWNSAGGRGVIPLTWTVVPNLADRVPQLYNYLYDTMTSKDYFVSGDNGAGYLNPTVLPAAYRTSWRTYNQTKFKQFDLDIAGFVISGFTRNLSNTVQQDYATFAPKGIGTNENYNSRLVNGMPTIRVYDLPNGNQPASAAKVEASLNAYLSTHTGQHFYAFRTILADPARMVKGVALYKAHHPTANVEVVDPYTFFRLYKASGLTIK